MVRGRPSPPATTSARIAAFRGSCHRDSASMSFPSKRVFMATVLLAMLGVVLCAGHARAAGPVIGHVTATEVEDHEVKVEAQVDPGGLETAYEIWLVWQEADPKGGPTNDGEWPTGGAQTQTGHLAAGSGDQPVSATFTDLQWGYVYWYVIGAANSAGWTRGESDYIFALHTSGEFPNGMGSGPPYESEIPIWYNQLSEEESAKTLKEYEARHAKELEAQRAREQEAQRAREQEEAEKASLLLSDSTVMVRHGRTALVKLECLGVAACRGKLALTAPGVGAHQSERKGVRHGAIGAGTFSIEGNEDKTIAVALNKAGRTLIGTIRGSISVSLMLQEVEPETGSKQTVRVRLTKKRP